MVLKLNKKEFSDFLHNSDDYVKFLIEELNKKGAKGSSIADFENQIETIQSFYEENYPSYSEIDKSKLRLSFWAFFSKLLIEKLGGELRIAPKNDFCAGTPQLIDFGNRFDKKGKRQWMGIGFDSWFNGVVEKKLLGTLKGTVSHVIEYYS